MFRKTVPARVVPPTTPPSPTIAAAIHILHGIPRLAGEPGTAKDPDRNAGPDPECDQVGQRPIVASARWWCGRSPYFEGPHPLGVLQLALASCEIQAENKRNESCAEDSATSAMKPATAKAVPSISGNLPR